MNLPEAFQLIQVAWEADLAAVTTEWDPLHVGFGRLLIILLFVLLNGFFVAAELAIVKVRPTQLDARAEKGDRRAKLARKIVDQSEAYLSATQLGITLASIALGVVAYPFFVTVLGPLLSTLGVTAEAVIRTICLLVAFAFVTFLHVVLGELIPKGVALRRALETTLLVAPALEVFHRVFQPAIWLFNTTADFVMNRMLRMDVVTENQVAQAEDELLSLVEESEKTSTVTEIEKEILINALELSDLVARDIMMPRSEVVTLDRGDSVEEAFRKATDSQHTRFPLVESHLDHALGLIHVKDLLRAMREGVESTLENLMRPLDPVPEKMPADRLLKMFLSRKSHMALVVDEYGGALGIVTLDNVLEELVGSIQDEFDHDEEEEVLFERINEDEFLVEGSFPLYELSTHTDLDLEDPEVSTVGGFVTHLLGHLPSVGEEIEVENYLAIVTHADEKRIHRLRFRRAEPVEVTEGREETERLSA